MMMKHAWTSALLACLLATGAGAQPAHTTWPAFLPRLLQKESRSQRQQHEEPVAKLKAFLPEAHGQVANAFFLDVCRYVSVALIVT